MRTLKKFSLRDLAYNAAYPFYEKRLMREIQGVRQPEHVAIMCDGNRRWAREAGFADVTHGHRVGAKKIGEMVRWCAHTDV
ncbi:undecaprenyl diphosphate synthase family protein, partial [Corynebacterium diphtheriae]